MILCRNYFLAFDFIGIYSTVFDQKIMHHLMINGHRGFVEGERGEGFWEESLMSLTYISYSHWLNISNYPDNLH